MTPLIGRPGTRHRVPRVPGWLRYRAYHTATGCTIKRMFGGKADGPKTGGSTPRGAESKGSRLEAARRPLAGDCVVSGTSPTGFEPVFQP